MKPAETFIKQTSNRFIDRLQNHQILPQLQQISCKQPLQEKIRSYSLQNQELLSFQACFSPKETAESLKRRNDGLKMLNFDNSDEDPDEIYTKRKIKVQNLMSKQQGLLQQINHLKNEKNYKYNAIISFTQFICTVKNNAPNIRTDYYSNKTFCALKNASENDVFELTKLLKNMYAQCMKISENSTNSQSSSCKMEDQSSNKSTQFLIIPRFLISKDKIQRLIKDQTLQQNFIFLVINKCLGHYNNQANKKMPEQYHMEYVRSLIRKSDGRQKFKRICSINHGSRILKNHSLFYYSLYSKSLDYLKFLQQQLKKGKKIQGIRKKLEGMKFQAVQARSFSSHTENDSSNSSVFSFGSFKEELGKFQKDPQSNNMEQQLIDSQPAEFQFLGSMKKHVKKLMSMPNQVQTEQRRFKVKKSLTTQQKKEPTIILIKPPSEI